MSTTEIREMADYMKAFSNPLRLQIIYDLTGAEKTVNQIVEDLDAKQCTVSIQLQYLYKKGILHRRAQAHNVYYSLADRGIVNMLDLVKIGQDMVLGK